jgi:hypothetical protein
VNHIEALYQDAIGDLSRNPRGNGRGIHSVHIPVSEVLRGQMIAGDLRGPRIVQPASDHRDYKEPISHLGTLNDLRDFNIPDDWRGFDFWCDEQHCACGGRVRENVPQFILGGDSAEVADVLPCWNAVVVLRLS